MTWKVNVADVLTSGGGGGTRGSRLSLVSHRNSLIVSQTDMQLIQYLNVCINLIFYVSIYIFFVLKSNYSADSVYAVSNKQLFFKTVIYKVW